MTGAIKDALVMFGRVPFAFYVAHVILIHAISVLLGLVQGFDGQSNDDGVLVLPEGIRRRPPGRLRGLGAGDRAAVSVLPLGRGGSRRGVETGGSAISDGWDDVTSA